MRKILLFISLSFLGLSIFLFILPMNITSVEFVYSALFILSLVLLGVADYMKFKQLRKR